MDSSEEGGGSPLRRNEGVKYYTELLDSSSSVERECSEEGGGSPVRRKASGGGRRESREEEVQGGGSPVKMFTSGGKIMAGIIMAGKYGGFNNEGIPQYPVNFPAIIFPPKVPISFQKNDVLTSPGTCVWLRSPVAIIPQI